MSKTLKINIFYSRPEYPENVIFVMVFEAIIKEENPEEFAERVFVKAFKKAHPTWKIKKVEIE